MSRVNKIYGDDFYDEFFVTEMLQSKCENRQDASLRCLEMILHKSPEYWKDVYEAGKLSKAFCRHLNELSSCVVQYCGLYKKMNMRD